MTDEWNGNEEEVEEAISPEAEAERVAQKLIRVLESTRLIEIVEHQVGINQVHLLGRVKTSHTKAYTDQVIRMIFKVTEGKCELPFLGTQYFPRNGDLRFGWVFTLQTPKLTEIADLICEAIDETIPRAIVEEVPMLGPPVPQSGGRGTGKRGAAPLTVR